MEFMSYSAMLTVAAALAMHICRSYAYDFVNIFLEVSSINSPLVEKQSVKIL